MTSIARLVTRENAYLSRAYDRSQGVRQALAKVLDQMREAIQGRSETGAPPGNIRTQVFDL